jgi:ketosteroid isomerase-like protein
MCSHVMLITIMTQLMNAQRDVALAAGRDPRPDGMVRPMIDDDATALWRSDRELVSAAMDHVRLSYCYLDDGDVDAYCSLFAEQAVLHRPGGRPVIGRTDLERFERHRLVRRPVRHSVREVFGSGRRVAAIGRFSHSRAPAGDHDPDLDFADVFTVSDIGLLLDRTTFLFTAPDAGVGHERRAGRDPRLW